MSERPTPGGDDEMAAFMRENMEFLEEEILDKTFIVVFAKRLTFARNEFTDAVPIGARLVVCRLAADAGWNFEKIMALRYCDAMRFWPQDGVYESEDSPAGETDGGN